MSDFSERLSLAMKRGDMTVSDLAVWFDRPRATVNTWVGGRTPSGPSGRRARRYLEMLQDTVRNKRGLPVPDTLLQNKRADYIRGVRDAEERHTRVPASRTAD